MNNIMLLGSLIGFAPAILLIWFSLHKYSYPYVEGSLFEDRRVFFMLAVGMVVGSLIFVLELMLYPLFLFSDGIDFVLFLLIFVLAFPFLEDMAKFIILNFKGYRGRFDSVFYGVSLGAGYSATAIIGYIVIDLGRTPGAIAPQTWLGLVFFSAATCLIHVSVGASLGSATGRNMGMKGIMPAILPHILFNLLMLPWFVYSQIWYSLIIALPVAALTFWGVHSRTIPESLPREIQRELRRDARRRVRR